jgi:hypothetical protein
MNNRSWLTGTPQFGRSSGLPHWPRLVTELGPPRREIPTVTTGMAGHALPLVRYRPSHHPTPPKAERQRIVFRKYSLGSAFRYS